MKREAFLLMVIILLCLLNLIMWKLIGSLAEPPHALDCAAPAILEPRHPPHREFTNGAFEKTAAH